MRIFPEKEKENFLRFFSTESETGSKHFGQQHMMMLLVKLSATMLTFSLYCKKILNLVGTELV